MSHWSRPPDVPHLSESHPQALVDHCSRGLCKGVDSQEKRVIWNRIFMSHYCIQYVYCCCIYWIIRTCSTASDTSIFKVNTVMWANSIVGTVHQSSLSASTLYIVQKNGSSSLPKEGKRASNCICGEDRVLLLSHDIVHTLCKYVKSR